MKLIYYTPPAICVYFNLIYTMHVANLFHYCNHIFIPDSNVASHVNVARNVNSGKSMVFWLYLGNSLINNWKQRTDDFKYSIPATHFCFLSHSVRNYHVFICFYMQFYFKKLKYNSKRGNLFWKVFPYCCLFY